MKYYVAQRRAFTITELLVVISIFVLVVGFAVPGFRAMINSSERSLAENQLRVGLSAARDVAIQSPSSDSAAVFFYQPNGRLSIVACVSVGFLDDVADNADVNAPTNAPRVRREVFVPVSQFPPLQMPNNWMVRGYTPPNTVHSPTNENGWYDSLTDQGGGGGGVDAATRGWWIFPETNFIDLEAPALGSNGWQRQSFMVRFKNGTGQLDSGNRALALVIDPIAAEGFRQLAPFDEVRLDKASDLGAFVSRLLAAQGLTQTEESNRLKLVGDVSIDSVLVRPVTELAVYSERNLIQALAQANGARGSSRATGTFYGAPTEEDGPVVEADLFATVPTLQALTGLAGLWIEGRLRIGQTDPTVNPAGDGSTLLETEARVFTLQQYLGQVEELP